MPNPVLFVGSSSEVSHLIEGLALNLGDDFRIDEWSKTAPLFSRSTLDQIERDLERADFAAFILAQDDVAVIRGQTVKVARDNVLLEIGMSFGRLGRDRTFLLAPRSEDRDQHVPSDLAGITMLLYDVEGGDSARRVMYTPAKKLKERMTALGRLEREGAQDSREREDSARGDTSHLETLADGALYVFESRHRYTDELRTRLFDGEIVPAKLQYAHPDGARHWIKLCRQDSYRYFHRAVRDLRLNKFRLANAIVKAAGTAAIDFISLGSGDGTKDSILLRALVPHLQNDQYCYYYPIDISDSLLVESVKEIARSGPSRDRFRCKPVLGDFTDLSALEFVLTYRPNCNLFSVLGNTLGTADEADIISSLESAMLPGDLVLFEVNTGDPENSKAMLKDDTANQWDVSTLDALGIARDPSSCDFEQEDRDTLSCVPKTRTLVSCAIPRSSPDGKLTTLRLSAMHHYDFAELKMALEKDLRVNTLLAINTDKSVGILLAQREATT